MPSLNLQTRFKAEATNGAQALDPAHPVNYSTADLALYSLREGSMHERFEATNGAQALGAALPVDYSTADLSRYSLPKRSMAGRFIEAAEILNRRGNYAAAVEHAFGDLAA